MADFLERPLRFEVFPSQPYDSDTDVPIIVDKKPRKILIARRLIKKTSEAAAKESRRTSNKTTHPQTIPIPEGPKTVTFRAIQKSNCTNKYLRFSSRQSDNSFLENERLCCINDEDTQNASHHGKLNYNGLQKRKLSESTNLLSKKRRTLEIESKSTTVKSSSKSKQSFKSKAMPNFARIFQVQSDNTENIIEYKERTADRATKLLSGAKPMRGAPALTTAMKVKKELTFTTENSPNITKLPKIKREAIICTPYPGKKGTPSSTAIPTKFILNKDNVTNRLRSASKPKPISSSTPNIATVNLLSGIQNKGHVPNLKLDNANRFGFKHVINQKSNKDTPSQTQTIPKSKSSAKIPNHPKKAAVTTKSITESLKNIFTLNPKSVTTLGTKLPIKKLDNLESVTLQPANAKPSRVKKDELVKAVQTKTRPEREINSRRLEIKGVRLNRRFELLMQMRGNDNSML